VVNENQWSTGLHVQTPQVLKANVRQVQIDKYLCFVLVFAVLKELTVTPWSFTLLRSKDSTANQLNSSDPVLVRLNLVDDAKEKAMGLGRAWDYPQLQKGQVYVSKKLADLLSLKVGDPLYLRY
jgi:hypothetical protein